MMMKMIEVFKTNVRDPDHASMLVDQIHNTFRHYAANFDLGDCDNILRVVSSNGHVQASLVLELISNFGFQAEVLSDDIPEFFHF